MTDALIAGWGAAALVLGVAWLHRPAPARLRALVTANASTAAASTTGTAVGLAAVVGRRVGRLLPGAASTHDPARLGRAVIAGAIALALVPLAAPPVAAVVWGWPAVRRRREVARHGASIAAAIPEVVDLLSVAIGGGMSVHLAVEAVARRATAPLGGELQAAVRDTRLGVPLADALEAIVERAGEPVRPVIAALVAAERYGAALSDTLHRLSADARDAQRRRAEEAARRVPVKLLFPLVLCVLPAFALLTVAPLIASALGSLRL